MSMSPHAPAQNVLLTRSDNAVVLRAKVIDASLAYVLPREADGGLGSVRLTDW
jgi:hypothetical protein